MAEEEEEVYDEEDALLYEKSMVRKHLYAKGQPAVHKAYSSMPSVMIAMLLCLALFLSMLGARLELQDYLKWPAFIDFMPLFILSCLVYIAATDYAATRLSTQLPLGRVVIIGSGLLGTLVLLLLFAFICLKLTGTVTWRWAIVISPFWVGLFFMQLLLVFTIPGFIRMNMLKTFFAVFVMIWMTSFSALLAALKLDGVLPGIHWWVVLLPVCAVLLGQLAVLDKQPVDVACRVTLLVCAVLLALRMDGSVKFHWATLLLPLVCVSVLKIIQISLGIDQDAPESCVRY
jgi:hypothetical protein